MSKQPMDETRTPTARWWWIAGVLTWLIPVAITVIGARPLAALGGELPVYGPTDAEISSFDLGNTLAGVGIAALAVWVAFVLVLGRGGRARSEAKAVLVIVGLVVAFVCILTAWMTGLPASMR